MIAKITLGAGSPEVRAYPFQGQGCGQL